MLAPGSLPLSRIMVRQYRYLGAPQEKITQAQLLEAKSLPPDQRIIGGGASASYFYDLDSRDEIAYARKLGKPILILHGARDYQVVDEDIDYWRKGLKGTPNVTIETIPKLNHLFIAGSGRPSPDEYSVPGHVDPEVIAKVSSFIKQ
jgi:dienelactone hydrolase